MSAPHRPAALDLLPDLPSDVDLDLGVEVRQQAGVSLVVRDGAGAELLFIKRARNPKDPWSGHMAFPGGRRAHHDEDLLRTAIRETHEEAGIVLRDDHLVGRMPTVAPKGPGLPTIVVVPFLFTLRESVTLRLDPREVERAVWVPLDTLLAPAHRDVYRVVLPTGPRDFPCVRVGDDVIWGMTFRIVEDLAGMLPPSR